ncbi:hypothetical protein, partial [Dysosmobacter sp.]|uniref:hypothetical protein n=1 Tax=Dysosmobacter sp. TaxID=2591382 RepID=UPI002A8F85A9
ILNITPGQTVEFHGEPCIVLEHRKDGTLLLGAEINFLRTPGLSEIVLPLTLPMLTGSRSPAYYLSVLERLKTSKSPARAATPMSSSALCMTSSIISKTRTPMCMKTKRRRMLSA